MGCYFIACFMWILGTWVVLDYLCGLFVLIGLSLIVLLECLFVLGLRFVLVYLLD